MSYETDSDTDSELSDSSRDFSFSESDEDEYQDDEFSQSYEPDEGVSSDEDTHGYCHWSRTCTSEPNSIKPVEGVWDANTTLRRCDWASCRESTRWWILIDTCIDAINNHAHGDASFQQTFGPLLKNEKHRALLRGFRAIKWHLGLLNIPQRQWAWSSDMLKRQPEIAKVLTFKQFKLLSKHFRVTSPAGLPPKDPSIIRCRTFYLVLKQSKLNHKLCGSQDGRWLLTKVVSAVKASITRYCVIG